MNCVLLHSKNSIKVCLCFALLILLFESTKAQHSLPDTLTAHRIHASINFDGNPNDSIWKVEPQISNFTQRELNFGEPATEKTETAILYDANNLYIGVWCYQKET